MKPWEEFAKEAEGPWKEFQSDSKVMRDARRYVGSTPRQLRAFTQGVTLGAADELDAFGAGVQTFAGNALKGLQGKPIDYSPVDAYRAVQQVESGDDRQFAQESPVQAAALNFGGAMATPGMGAVGNFVTHGAPRAVAAVQGIPVIGNALAGFMGAGRVAQYARAGAVGGAGGGIAGAMLAEPGQRGEGAVRGAAVGAPLGLGMQGAMNALAPRARQLVETPQRRLSRQGVNMTPGQLAGGMGKRFEDVATSLPFTGGAINRARGRSLDDLNRVATNRTLDPIGEVLDTATAPGYEAVQEATGKISDAYTAALNPVTVVPDAELDNGLAAVLSQRMPESTRKEIEDIIQITVKDRLGQSAPGQEWKRIDAELGAMLRAADNASGQKPGEIYAKNAIQQVQREVRALLERQDPQAYAAVRQADEATANLVRLRQGAQGIGAEEGVMTAPQLRAAVRATDSSANNRDFGTGQALMQDLARDAVAVLPSKVPDSGTAVRGLVGMGAYGGLAGATSPTTAITGAVADLIGSGLYSKPVVDLVNNIYRATDPATQRNGLAALQQLAQTDPQVAQLLAAISGRGAGAVIEQTQRSLTPGISVEVPGLGASYQ